MSGFTTQDTYSAFNGTYPIRKASGINQFVANDPQFYLWAGDGERLFDRCEVEAGQQIANRTLVAMNAAGNLVPWLPAGAQPASGSILFQGSQDPEFLDPYGSGANPYAGDTVTIGTSAITFVTGVPAGAQVLIGALPADTALNLTAYINTNTATLGVVAERQGQRVMLVSNTPGVAGNSVALAISSTALKLPTATLTGGIAAGTVSSQNVLVGVLAEDMDTTTATGTGVPTYCAYWKKGQFNHVALVWPTSLTTLHERRQAVVGSHIDVARLP